MVMVSGIFLLSCSSFSPDSHTPMSSSINTDICLQNCIAGSSIPRTPLGRCGREEGVIEEVDAIVDKYDLEILRDELVCGARLAYSSENLDRLNLSDHERRRLQVVKTDKWRQTGMMYILLLSSKAWTSCHRSTDVSRH